MRYFCPACREQFDDDFACGVASGTGGMAPAECPRCGDEESIEEVTFRTQPSEARIGMPRACRAPGHSHLPHTRS